MTDHSTITDPDIHEPRGIDFAPANSVYVADGEGGGSWQVLPSTDPNLIKPPVGSVDFFPTTDAQLGWLVCDGAEISRSTYSALFSVIGTTYGIGDDSTTFNLPDLRGYIIAGLDLMGGISADRLTNKPGGVDGDILGAKGGSYTHTLTTNQIPSFAGTTTTDGGHSHSSTVSFIRAAGGSASYADSSPSANQSGPASIGSTTTSAGSHSHTLTLPGGGAAHPNSQPTMVLVASICTGVFI